MARLSERDCDRITGRIRRAQQRLRQSRKDHRGEKRAYKAVESLRTEYLTGGCTMHKFASSGEIVQFGQLSGDHCRDKAGKWVPVPQCRGHYIPRSSRQEEEAMARRRKRRATHGLSCGCGMGDPGMTKTQCEKAAERVAKLLDEGDKRTARSVFQKAAAAGCGSYYSGLGRIKRKHHGRRKLGSKKRATRRRRRG